MGTAASKSVAVVVVHAAVVAMADAAAAVAAIAVVPLLASRAGRQAGTLASSAGIR